MTIAKYLVGGAVRDILLGLEPKDKDYVVTGFRPEQLLSLGFKQVGQSFPVFLCPDTGDEYALARKEKSTGPGYHDFETDFAPTVTLEEDLYRRDLTINAMAMTDQGNIIDPYNGQKDLEKKVLRHTSEAFVEDPLRVLRLARFKTKLGMEWSIHSSTKQLVTSNLKFELSFLTPERVWIEVEKALSCPNPSIFFKTLLELNVLDVVFPRIFDMVTCIENSKWHMEPSVFEHSMHMLDSLPVDAPIEFKLFCIYHDIAKPPLRRINGHAGGHDNITYIENSNLIDMFIPGGIRRKMMFYISNHLRLFSLFDLSVKKQVKHLLEYKTPEQLLNQLYLGEIDNKGAITHHSVERTPIDHTKVMNMYTAVKEVSLTPEEYTFYNGESIKNMLHQRRIQAIRNL